MEGFIVPLIIGAIILINALIKKARDSGQKVQARPDRGGEYEASQEKIQDFLEGVLGQRRQAPAQPETASPQQDAYRPPGRPALSGQPVEVAIPEARAETPGADQWFVGKKGRRYGPYNTDQVRAFVQQGRLGPKSLLWNPQTGKWQQVRSTEECAGALKETVKQQTSAPSRPSPPKQAARPTGAALPLQLMGSDLKRAVVWAEILGPPVSMRSHRGHRPPTAGR